MSRQEFVVAFLAFYWLSSFYVIKVSADDSFIIAPLVKVSVYYETLCPDSQAYITEQLWPTYQKVSDIMELELIPFGFATETPLNSTHYIYTCQHGKDECYGNAAQSCAIHLLKNMSLTLNLINCMESKPDPHMHGRKCAIDLEINYLSIEACAYARLGNELQHEMATKTKNLNPPMKFVPWNVIDGNSDSDMQERATKNLLGVVCTLYKGKKPKPCSSA